jgi:glutamate 5-kinase
MEIVSPPRPGVADARRVVLKLGTRVLTHDDGALAFSRLVSVAETAAALRRQGREVLIVSSGAIGLGREALGLKATPTEVDERQACAAVGQTRLMWLYQDAFSRLGLLCGQLLLTEPDFDDRERYLNLRAALHALLRHRVIPIINENDAISTQELALTTGPRPVFGDNDRLSALVATKLEADLLILFTDVAGLYDQDPRTHPGAAIIRRVDHPGEVGDIPLPTGITAGRGGMRSKVEAASMAARGGCHVVITSGREPEKWPSVFAGQETGTWFPARVRPHARQRWIAFAAASRGVLTLDPGAVKALTERHASLLAAGVTAVEGNFRTGDVVELRGEGRRLGRGIIAWDAATVRAWCSGHPPEGVRNAHALIRRDDIVLETE